mmetsp:Transcript_86975/g.259452  ORF Transcript_86975/g.259452 Transcript_86975/m.259452 type:complete len:211 (+) Transcript_86975:450-1082(+)
MRPSSSTFVMRSTVSAARTHIPRLAPEERSTSNSAEAVIMRSPLKVGNSGSSSYKYCESEAASSRGGDDSASAASASATTTSAASDIAFSEAAGPSTPAMGECWPASTATPMTSPSGDSSGGASLALPSASFSSSTGFSSAAGGGVLAGGGGDSTCGGSDFTSSDCLATSGGFSGGSSCFVAAGAVTTCAVIGFVASADVGCGLMTLASF